MAIPIHYVISVYSNDGSTLLENVSAEGSTIKVNEAGFADALGAYTYDGEKKFLGLATSANATTPTYAIGDSFTINSDTNLYIVEEQPKEYTLRIDGVEVTNYENIIVNGVSYKLKNGGSN